MKTERKLTLNTSIQTLKRALKYVLYSRTNTNWVISASSVAAVGLAGLGIAALTLKDNKYNKWGLFGRLSFDCESEKESTTEFCVLVPGLQNLGNNCFLNAVLQALASCFCFQPYLEQAGGVSESSAVEQDDENMPLTVALTTLIKDLCSVSDKRYVLSPRKVMLAMSLYIPNFNLTNQQDAAEAFLHLLSSLRAEYADGYLQNVCSLADVPGFRNCRIVALEQGKAQTEQKKWQRYFLGPFDGILCSILSCQSCSSQISLDFQYFHSLSLSPVLSGSTTIMFGCTLQDCLKKFVTAENVENYRCGNCWHVAAKKYLIATGAGEADIEHLEACCETDSCDCRSRFGLQALPWSNNISYTLKQLTIARGPKILCIHLQRASINMFGELIKLQGHIKFPLILDLLPFMSSGVEIKNWEGPEKFHSRNCVPQSSKYNAQFNVLNNIYGLKGNSTFFNTPTSPKSGSISYVNNVEREAISIQSKDSLKSRHEDKPLQYDKKLGVTQPVLSGTHLYQLVSVVEHFGRSGSGHYTVYRSLREGANDTDPGKNGMQPHRSWFCISDSEVFSVSEREVLNAEASMLFYEKL